MLALAALCALAAAVLPLADAFGQETITTLAPIAISTTTGEKPQSKVWRRDGRWWAVLASSDVSPSGTWLWRLESNNQWTNVLRLSSSTSARADARAVGDVTHILLHGGTGRLVSVEYRPAQQTYVLWPQRTTTTSISLSNSETATIDVDSTGRMWLATDSSSSILVYYSDPPYAAFQGPISLARGTSSDDIAVVTAVPLPGVPSIGVLWSNQDDRQFGFRLHVDGLDPLSWLADEIPGSQSARDAGGGLADDHLHVATGSDGTLYAAVKTSYNDGESGFPQIGLLRRHPGGTWDGLYTVDNEGTRGIVLLNEPANLLRVIYRDDGSNDIVYRDSPTTNIRFGSRKTLIDGPLNDPTSTKDNWTTELVVIADGQGVLIRRPPTTTTTTTSTTTTTLPPGVHAVEVRVASDADDAEEAEDGDVNLSSADLELVDDGGPQTVGLRFQGVAVPRAAIIRNAYVQFQVDEVSSGPTALTIRGQASDQAATFTSAARNVSARPPTATAVPWSPPAWPTEGAAGPAQRTPGLAGVIQEIVNRPGWSSGNALALVVTGSGHRVAKAHDGLPAAAPLLRVEYSIPSTTTTTSTTTTSTTSTTTTTTTTPIPTTTTTTLIPGVITVRVRVAGASDDAEEAESGAVELASGDLELVDDGGLQTVGLRFAGVNVPRGVTIRDAFVQFEVDEPTSQETSLTIAGQASDQAATFTSAARNVSARPRTTAAVSWSPPTWPTEGAAGAAQRTPSLAPVIQEIVSRIGWTSGNALALIITGDGRRVARSFDGQPDGAPRLRIDYDLASIPTTTTTSTSVTTTSITTTTLPPCTTLRCVLETARSGPSCEGQSLSAKVTRKLARTLAQAEAAPGATPRKAVQRYTHAKRLLRQVGKAIESAARRRRPKLSVACAADLRAAVQTGISLIDDALGE